VPFFISHDRFDGRNRAGSGFFHFNDVFMFKFFKKIVSAVKILPNREFWICYNPENFWNAMNLEYSHYMGVRNPGMVTIRRTFGRDVPTLALHGINGNSAGNYHLMDEEFTGEIGFRRQLPAHR
jgi:hypothetical protein